MMWCFSFNPDAGREARYLAREVLRCSNAALRIECGCTPDTTAMPPWTPMARTKVGLAMGGCLGSKVGIGMALNRVLAVAVWLKPLRSPTLSPQSALKKVGCCQRLHSVHGSGASVLIHSSEDSCSLPLPQQWRQQLDER